MTIICGDCGVTEGQSAHSPCVRCGEDVYDLDDPADAEFLESLTRQRLSTAASRAAMVALAVAAVATLLVPGMARLGIIGFGLFGLPVYWMGRQIQTMRLSPERRAFDELALSRKTDAERIRRNRWLTSGPFLVAVFVLVLHPIAMARGPLPYLAVPRAIRNGEQLWTLFTASLLHANAVHVIANAAVMLLWGQFLDLRVGRLRTVGVILATATFGLAMHSLFTGLVDTPSAGISGGIYGMLGASLSLMPNQPSLIAFGGVRIPTRNWVRTLYLMVLFTGLDYLTNPHVAWLAHAGGFLLGVVLGLALRRRPIRDEFVESQERLERRLAALRD